MTAMMIADSRTMRNAGTEATGGRRPFGHVFAGNVLLLVCTLSLGIGYMVLNNVSSTNGFAIRKLEQRIADLEQDQKTLKIDEVAAQSLKDIESKVAGLGFVPVSRIDYLTVTDGAVAVLGK